MVYNIVVFENCKYMAAKQEGHFDLPRGWVSNGPHAKEALKAKRTSWAVLLHTLSEVLLYMSWEVFLHTSREVLLHTLREVLKGT